MGAPSSSEWAELLSWAERRAQGEPLAYLEGKVGFYGLEFKVDSRVLIPRPDSECLVEAGLASLQGKESPKVLDLGTGSGCLLLATLAHHQTARGTGVDRDPGALEVAEENATALGLRSRASFQMGNWFDGLEAKPFDLILCNPPYVQPGEELGPGVEEFEPAMALFTPPDDPLWCYREILESVSPFLSAESRIILEIGFGRVKDVERCVVAHGFRVAGVHLDLAKVPRALSVGF
jgi:release factor glutamine methyltransferase